MWPGADIGFSREEKAGFQKLFDVLSNFFKFEQIDFPS